LHGYFDTDIRNFTDIQADIKVDIHTDIRTDSLTRVSGFVEAKELLSRPDSKDLRDFARLPMIHV